MGSIQWQTPLADFVDPTKLPNLAADNGEVAFAAGVASASYEPHFLASYTKILSVLATEKIIKQQLERLRVNLDIQLATMPDGWKNIEANKRIFFHSSAIIKKFLSGPGKTLSGEKRSAWQKCQTHLSAWQGAYSSSPNELIAAISVDSILFSQKGPISIEEALKYVKQSGNNYPETLPDIVRWYMLEIRQKYRNDITIKAEQVSCARCGGFYEKGRSCPQCQRAEMLIDEARKALLAKRWKEAEGKANEVFLIWTNNTEASDIIEKARKGAEIEQRQAKEAAEREAKLKREEAEAREAERKRREAEAEQRRLAREAARSAAKKRYEEALLSRDWGEAERIARERVNLDDGTIEQWQAEIKKQKDKHRQYLEKECKNALEVFDKILPVNLEEADACLVKIEKNLIALEREFTNSTIVNLTRNGIETRRTKLAKERNSRLIDNLRGVENLKAVGSKDGQPIVALSWSPAPGGTKADKWRILRREKNNADHNIRRLADVDSPSFTDKESGLKIGVEYEYGIVPLVEVEFTPGRKELKANEKLEANWSPATICLAQLPIDVLKGKGEGIDGGNGVVSLWWSFPLSIDGITSKKVTLTRTDGVILDKDVSGYEGRFEDENVHVGYSYSYILRAQLNGYDMGSSKLDVSVERITMPPKVSDFSLSRQSGSLLVRWKWPAGLDACLWGVSKSKANTPEELPRTARRMVSREIFDREGGVKPVVPANGETCWITVFGERTLGKHELFSQGEGIPISETILEYYIENHPKGLFSKRKPAWLIINSSSGYIPEIEIRAGKNRSEVLSRHGGRVAFLIPQASGQSVKRIALADNVHSGEFIHAYLVRPDMENCKLNHPSDFEVK